jgi:hypothetical protein
MTPRVARASGHKDRIDMTEHTNIGSVQRSWAERVIALDPPMVTGAVLATITIGPILMEVFPIGSLLSRFAFALSALLSFSAIFLWTKALNAVAHSRLGSSEAVVRKQRALFRSLVFWTLVWCGLVVVLPFVVREIFAVYALATLVVGYFYLCAVWATTRALLAFEKSNDAFWTFIQVLYFPVGVWFLRPRLQQLLSASPQTAASLA